MKIVRHVLIVTISLLVLLGIPVYFTGYFQRKLSGVDAVSAATVIVDAPSGAYVVLINPSLHQNTENLSVWESFFAGEEIDFLFEDISCVVADIDTSAYEIARSFQSRLPENQMTIRKEDITLMLSKAMNDKYDVVLMSKEIFDVYKADYGMDDSVIIEGEN